MRKKLISMFIAVLLVVCLIPCSALAVGVLPQPDEYYYSDGYSDPTSYPLSPYISDAVINVQPQSVNAVKGGVPVSLRVGAYSPDGGSVGYQWYISYTGSSNDLSPLVGANSSVYTPAQVFGTVFYCVSVYNTYNGERGNVVMSDMVAVTYSGLEIINLPKTTEYVKGSNVDLSGLAVRVHDGTGSYWDSYNGSGLSVYPSTFNTAGKVAVEVSYGSATDYFYVNVGNAVKNADTKDSDGKTTGTVGGVSADGSHTHVFGEWEVTKPATCVTTGTQTRQCQYCDYTETEEIAKTAHTWDEGVVTKEPTAASNGARLYTCTICKANKSEIIPAGTSVDATPKPAAQTSASSASSGPSNTYSNINDTASTPYLPTSDSLNRDNPGATVDNNADNTGVVSKTSADSSGWWLIPVSALLLVGLGSGAYYLMRRKGGE